MSDKTAIVVFSDPKSGSEEALGRLFNALFLTYELKHKGRDVALILQGTGVRWASEIVKPNHPAHEIYKAVEDKLAGVCGGCADVFGATQAVEAAGVTLVRQADIPGTTGVIDLSQYLDDGWRMVAF